MVFSTSKFESLSIRPPTPPKDLEESDKDADDALQFLEDPFGTGSKAPLAKVAAAKSLLSTPEQSPSSEVGSPSSTASRKKRVNFELSTCNIPSTVLSPQPWTPARSSPLRPLPQTRVPRQLKSILKTPDPASTPPPADEAAAACNFKTFAEMLDSLVKQLAREARASRLDAYHSLQRTMQAYENVPDTQALIQKMGLLTQFVRRDVQATSIAGSGPDSQLISQALKFLMALFRLQEIRQAMDDEFCSFVVERIIQIAGDASMPKTVVNTHLATLMQQNFRPRVMTTTHVERVLDVLETIHERISGQSVLAYRIRIYRKLIQQKTDVMIKHTDRWFKHCVKALLSNQKDINQSAIDTVICAAKTIGNDRHVTKSVLAVLNRVDKDGITFAKRMTVELEKILASDSASTAPQIWAVVTALLRDSINHEAFPAVGDWLRVFEKFLNGNESVKYHGNVAFGCLMYAVNISHATPRSWSSMCLKIPQLQFQRRTTWKKPERDSATAAYFTLLYYALPPTASHEQLDRYWTEFVADFWNPLVHASSPMLALAACRVVSALLNGSRRPWDEQRALDLRPQSMVQRDELPLLDPKWVRKSISTVLKLVETLLDAAPWVHDSSEDEPAKTLWRSLLSSLVEAGSKEVMASMESKDAMAHIVNLLRRVWDRHTEKLAISQQKEDNWANKFCFLIETVIERLGALQFADKCLGKNGDNEFQVAPTPTHRSRQQGARISPLLYFVDLLVNQSEEKLSDHVRLRALTLIMEPCLAVQNTRLGKLELLRDCAAVANSASGATVTSNFWAQTAALATTCIQAQPSDPNERVSRQLGKEYEVVVDILSLGSPSLLDSHRGHNLLQCFVDTVRREAGEGALILAVIEKVSERILMPTKGQDIIACLPFCSMLLRNLPKTPSRRTLDQARQTLWPSAPAPARNSEFDPFNHFYAALVSLGSAAYRDLDASRVDVTREFLAAVATSIQHYPNTFLAVYLRKIQEPINVWVEDADKKLQVKTAVKSLHREVEKLWQAVCGAIDRLPRKDSQMLFHLEPLIGAGFLSRRRGIVNASIKSWNITFGKEECLRYPARLEQALRRLQGTVEISLPSLEVREQEETKQSPFYESDDSAAESAKASRTPRVKESPFKVLKSTHKSRSPAVSSTGSKRRTRSAQKARLRHDNSQIQFEPIVSSPSDPFLQESQVLTERQKETMERQRSTANIFANMGATTSRQEAALSRNSALGVHSGARGVDDLPVERSRTPRKSLASLGPMDMFLGSSPTPQGRSHSQHIVSDETSVATPTAVRTVQLKNETEDFGSSPPQPVKTEADRGISPSSGVDEAVEDSFDFRQPVKSLSVSFGEGTTVDEDALPEAGATGIDFDDELHTDAMESDMPSSTIDLQLTAQFDAEINAQINTSVGIEQDLHNARVDARAHHQTVDVDTPGSDTEVDDMEVDFPAVPQELPRTRSGNGGRISESFASVISNSEKSTMERLRRSARNSAPSSPAQPSSARKRKQPSIETPGRSKRGRKGKNKTEEAIEEQSSSQAAQEGPVEADESGVLDNIVVSVPKCKRGRKPKTASPRVADSQPLETARKRSTRQSTLLLSHTETPSEDVLVEDTPVPKKPRRSASQDAGQARTTSSPDDSQIKRLSHVQITSKRSPENSSSARDSSVAAESQQDDKGNAHDAQPVPDDTTAPFESQQPQASADTSGRSFAQRVILTPRSIIDKIRGFTAFFSGAKLAKEEEREFDDALFDLRREVHAAGRRGEGGQ